MLPHAAAVFRMQPFNFINCLTGYTIGLTNGALALNYILWNRIVSTCRNISFMLLFTF